MSVHVQGVGEVAQMKQEYTELPHEGNLLVDKKSRAHVFSCNKSWGSINISQTPGMI